MPDSARSAPCRVRRGRPRWSLRSAIRARHERRSASTRSRTPGRDHLRRVFEVAEASDLAVPHGPPLKLLFVDAPAGALDLVREANMGDDLIAAGDELLRLEGFELHVLHERG